MTVTLVLPPEIAARVDSLCRLDVETGAVLLARPVEDEHGNLRLLTRAVYEVPEHAYDRREASQLLIRPEGYVPALAEAEATGCVPIWFHTHPGQDASPKPSSHDRAVDGELTNLFRLRADSKYYGALIASPSKAKEGLRFSGHLESDDGHKLINRIFIPGNRLALYLNHEAGETPLPELFDRNISAFGGDVQRILGSLHISIVGAGGTGSAVAEQLVRLGVRHLQLLDPDELSLSNVTRVYGSTLADVGHSKVEVLANHLRSIAPDLSIETINESITSERVALQLIGTDIIFGCTDDNAGRLVLSRFATYLMVPVIDCGVILTSGSESNLNGIFGRVTILHPGEACLVCRDRIDTARAASEVMAAAEQERLAAEGYAPALAGVEPAVIAYTTSVAAMAVAELLERLTYYGSDPVPSEVLLRLHDREMSTNQLDPRPRHYCHPDSGKIGLGLTPMFLEQTWPN